MTTTQSQISTAQAVPFGTVSEPLVHDRRNSQVWVPKSKDYGGDLPLMVGIDAEWQNEGDLNNVLSYQFYATDRSGSEWTSIWYPQGGKRYSLSPLLSCVVMKGIQDGHIRKWPKAICLMAHFSLSDLTALFDFPNLKTLVDSVRRTLITIRDPMRVKLWDEHRHAHEVTVTLRDSLLLAPAGRQSLADLGDLVGLEKMALNEGEIENMDALLRDDPERFEAYAKRDPEISVRYCIKVMQLNHDLTGKAEIPPTLSSIGIDYLLRLWREMGIDPHAVLGTEVVDEQQWSERRNHSFRRKKTVPTAERYTMESFATECYHGGRNEQYFFGAGNPGVWTDWDLSSAYTTAMAIICLPDWSAIRQTRDLDEFQPHVMGYARVRFRFPDGTRFPCLPVRTSGGLLFPLEGVSYCCSPEIYLARKLGAQLEILIGCVLPSSFETRPFEAFIIECIKRRKSFTKGALEELLWKEIGNSTYGKTAQGLRKKRCFDSRTGEYGDLPPSKITNPYLAAYTTSFVRAVLGEIIAALPLHRSVCSATTDGFLTDATDEEVMAATEGPLGLSFAQTRLRLSGDTSILERKHRIAQPLGWRTRGQATLVEIPSEKPVLAKAGLKPPMKEKAAHNDWIVGMFINRNSETRQSVTMLRNLPEIWKQGGDLVNKEIVRRVNMDYDWKRQPVDPSMRPVKGVEHLYFDTKPWKSAEDFQQCRDAWEQYRGTSGRVLKNEGDLEHFNDFRAVGNVSGKHKVQRSLTKSSLTLAKRMFLRAYTRSVWGLDVSQMSYSEIARWLCSVNCPTTKADVENARRPNSKLVESLVPSNPDVIKLVEAIELKFPAFQRCRLLKG